MDIQVLITTSTTDSTGPFNIIGNPGNVTIATGQTKSELVAGKTFTGVSELISQITITDTGVCNQAVTRSVIGAGGVTPTPTPQLAVIHWQLAQGSGSGLIIESASAAQLLNETASGASTKTGTLYVNSSDLPYTVIGRWNSGSSNIVRYIICDDGGSTLYASSPIDNMAMEEAHTVTPTPNVITINVVGQDNIPSCYTLPV
jgi:hypothetical protein